jgi:hypothetical protein
MKHIHLFLSFVLFFSTNLLIASSPARPGPTFGNTGVITLCVNGSYYLNPSTTLGTFSSIDPLIATVNASGYVTGVSLGTTTISLVATEGGTVTATVTVVASLSPSLSITDPLAQSSYKFNNNPQGPIAGINNYIGYNGFNYSSQARPIKTGYFRVSNQLGDAAGCPYEFDIFRCTTCGTVPDNTPHSIGESYGGGIVFYVTDGGLHGLIAAPSDEVSRLSWADAITACNNKTIDVYSDWYLPSKYELNLMRNNIGQGAPSPYTNVGGFADNVYWSSTEFGANFAWLQNVFNGLQYNSFNKSEEVYVRAIRAF